MFIKITILLLLAVVIFVLAKIALSRSSRGNSERKQAKTTWESIKENAAAPAEDTVYNPLNLTVGGMIHDFRDDLTYNIQEICEYDAHGFNFTDYHIVDETDGKKARVRVSPGELRTDPDNYLFMRLHDEFGYDEGLHNMLKEDCSTFQDDELGLQFSRINGNSSPIPATLTILQDHDGNNRVDSDEIETVNLQFWDFYNQDRQEFFFVELEDGWFRLWIGKEVTRETFGLV